MSYQKSVILVLSVLGMVSAFLPWIKGFYGVTLHGISIKGGDKAGIWVVMACFIIVSLICLINQRRELKRWALYGVLLSAIITIYISISYLTMDLNSRMIDYFLDINDASELGLTVGLAPYFVLLSGLLIFILSIILKQKKVEVHL